MKRKLAGYVVEAGVGLLGADDHGLLWHTCKPTLFASRKDVDRAIRASKKDSLERGSKFWEKVTVRVIALYS